MVERRVTHRVFGEVLRPHPDQILLQQRMHTIVPEALAPVTVRLGFRRGIMRPYACKHWFRRPAHWPTSPRHGRRPGGRLLALQPRLLFVVRQSSRIDEARNGLRNRRRTSNSSS